MVCVGCNIFPLNSDGLRCRSTCAFSRSFSLRYPGTLLPCQNVCLSVSIERAVTLPSVSLTLRDLEKSASKLARDLGRSPGTVRRSYPGLQRRIIFTTTRKIRRASSGVMQSVFFCVVNVTKQKQADSDVRACQEPCLRLGPCFDKMVEVHL